MRLMLHLITYIPKVVCLYFYEYAQALSSISIAQNLEIRSATVLYLPGTGLNSFQRAWH